MLKTKKAAQRAANNLTCRSRNNMFKEKNAPKVVQWAAYNLPAAQNKQQLHSNQKNMQRKETLTNKKTRKRTTTMLEKPRPHAPVTNHI